MRVNKISICVTTLITISSLAIAIALNYFCFEFVANTLIGVFASGFLALILAIIGYFVEGFNGMGKSMVMEFTHNKLVEDLRSELDGEFYKLMYPLKRKEDYHAD